MESKETSRYGFGSQLIIDISISNMESIFLKLAHWIFNSKRSFFCSFMNQSMFYGCLILCTIGTYHTPITQYPYTQTHRSVYSTQQTAHKESPDISLSDTVNAVAHSISIHSVLYAIVMRCVGWVWKRTSSENGTFRIMWWIPSIPCFIS